MHSINKIVRRAFFIIIEAANSSLFLNSIFIDFAAPEVNTSASRYEYRFRNQHSMTQNKKVY